MQCIADYGLNVSPPSSRATNSRWPAKQKRTVSDEEPQTGMLSIQSSHDRRVKPAPGSRLARQALLEKASEVVDHQIHFRRIKFEDADAQLALIGRDFGLVHEEPHGRGKVAHLLGDPSTGLGGQPQWPRVRLER